MTSCALIRYDADQLLNLLQRVLAAESGTSAGALAGTDPHRDRLIADAERAAQSITNDAVKDPALAAIARALAATDPNRDRLIADAERATQTPSWTNSGTKARALAAIAKALAATAPDR